MRDERMEVGCDNRIVNACSQKYDRAFYCTNLCFRKKRRIIFIIFKKKKGKYGFCVVYGMWRGEERSFL